MIFRENQWLPLNFEIKQFVLLWVDNASGLFQLKTYKN